MVARVGWGRRVSHTPRKRMYLELTVALAQVEDLRMRRPMIVSSAQLGVRLRERLQNTDDRSGGPAAVLTGITGFDNLADGLPRGAVTLLTAERRHDLLSFVYTVIGNVAVSAGQYAVLVSTQSAERYTSARLVSVVGGLGLARLRRGYLKANQLPILTEAAARLAAANLLVQYAPEDDGRVALRAARSHLRRRPVDFVAIDCLSLSPAIVTDQLPRLRAAAIRRGAAVLVAGLSSPPREIGSWFDTVVEYRRRYPSPDVELAVQKNRYGPTGAAYARADDECGRLTDP